MKKLIITGAANGIGRATLIKAIEQGDIATDLMAEYYRQRASAGFMVSEGTQIEPRGQGYAWTPGIYNAAQVDGWRTVTDAVHADGGVIFAQLWHVGRVSHPGLQPEGAAPVAPSAIAPLQAKAFIETAPGAGELVQPPVPRALSILRRFATRRVRCCWTAADRLPSAGVMTC